MYYPEEVIDDVRSGNDIVDVIGQYVQLKRSGSNYLGLCPFHHEKTPSFSVNREAQYYYCFGCHAGGNVITFLMQHQNYSFPDAVKYLAERINYTLPEAEYSADYEYRRQLKQKLYDMHKIAARFYYDSLNTADGMQAVRYLDERRIVPQMRIKFGLGYSPGNNALYKLLRSKGYDDETIVLSGLVRKNADGTYGDFFYRRVMFPIIDVHGHIIAFGARTLESGKVKFKYLNSGDTPIFSKRIHLYNLNFARQSKMREFILVEGYMDAISIYQAGFHNVVASLGTAFNKEHTKTLKPYADSVILLFDSDGAGVDAVLRTIPIMNEAGIKVKVLQVTDAKDPDEFIKKFGASEFGRLLATARSQYSFLIDNALKKYDLNKSEDKISFANEAAKILSAIDNAIEADLYIREVAEDTGISQEAIKSEIARIKGVEFTQAAGMQKPAPVRIAQGGKTGRGVDEARKSLICIMTGNPSLCEKLKTIIKAEEFCEPFYITMVNAIYNAVDNGRPVVAANITGCFETAQEQQRAVELFVRQMTFDSTDKLYKAASDQLKVVKEAYINEKLKNTDDNSLTLKLIEEKRNIQGLTL